MHLLPFLSSDLALMMSGELMLVAMVVHMMMLYSDNRSVPPSRQAFYSVFRKLRLFGLWQQGTHTFAPVQVSRHNILRNNFLCR